MINFDKMITVCLSLFNYLVLELHKLPYANH